MPNSVRCIIKKCLHKGAINQQEFDKIMRKLDELIRCKDCKYGGSDGGCDFLSTLTLYPVNTEPDDYCSAWAERDLDTYLDTV